jgi:hypothetical protein
MGAALGCVFDQGQASSGSGRFKPSPSLGVFAIKKIANCEINKPAMGS